MDFPVYSSIYRGLQQKPAEQVDSACFVAIFLDQTPKRDRIHNSEFSERLLERQVDLSEAIEEQANANILVRRHVKTSKKLASLDAFEDFLDYLTVVNPQKSANSTQFGM